MKATLNSFIDNNDKIKYYIAVCKEKGIEVLSPNVNKSQEQFAVDYSVSANTKKAPIRFGLKGIKSLGAKSKLVIAEREANGEFTSYQDFVKRMIGIPKFDKSAIVALILAGALDEFEGSRQNKIDALEDLEKIYKSEAVARRNGQMTILELAEELGDNEFLETVENINDVVVYTNVEYDNLYKLDKEKEYTGFYISAHPVDDYKELFTKKGAIDISNLVKVDTGSDIETDGEEIDELVTTNDVDTEKYVDTTISVAGILKDIDVRYTKKDSSKMKTFVVEDDTDSIKCVLFPKKLQEGNNDKITEEKALVLITGRLVEDESFGRQILVETVRSIDTLLAEPKEFIIPVTAEDRERLNIIGQSIKPFLSVEKTDVTVAFQYKNTKKVFGYINPTLENLEKIQRIVGENGLIIK